MVRWKRAVVAKFAVERRPRAFVLRREMLAFALPALAAFTPYEQLKAARVQDPRTSALVSPLDGLAAGRSLVVVLPQLGEFDSAEMCEQLVAVADDLQAAGVALRVVGIGDQAAGQRFSDFTGLPLEALHSSSSRPSRRSASTLACTALTLV